MMERIQPAKVVTPVPNSDIRVVVQNHLPFFCIIQKVEGAQWPDKRLYSSDTDVAMTLIEAMAVQGSLHLSIMNSVNVMEKVLQFLDLDDFVPDVDTLVNSFVKATDVNSRA